MTAKLLDDVISALSQAGASMRCLGLYLERQSHV